MTMSSYLRDLRAKIGTDLLLVPTVAGIVFDSDGRVLLAHHMDARLWVLPGGHVDPGETPADAVAREVWEETGLAVEPAEIIGVFGGTPEFEWTYRNGDRVAFVMTAFVCERRGGELRPDGEETSAVRFFARDELPSPAEMVPCARVLLDAAFARAGRTFFERSAWRPV